MTSDQHKPTENQHTDNIFSLLSDIQWRFVTAMIDNPSWSKREAAQHIGLLPDTVYRWPDYVNAAILEARRNVHAAVVEMRKQAVIKAMAVKVRLLDSDDENVRSKAASDIIEWELGKASTKISTEIDGKLQIEYIYPDNDHDNTD